MALRSTDPEQEGQIASGRPTVAAFDFDGTLTDSGSVFPFLVSLRGAGPCCGPSYGSRRSSCGPRWPAARRPTMRRSGCSIDSSEASPSKRSTATRPRSPVATCSATCARTRGAASSGTAGRVTTSSSSRPRPSATSARPGRSSGSTASWPRGSPSAAAGSSPGATRGRTAVGPRSTPAWSSTCRARGLLSSNGGEQPVLWAYGNSRGDLRLLNAADHGVDAGRLGPLGRLRRFPRLSTVAGSAGGDGDAHDVA